MNKLENLNTQYIGRNVIHYEKIDSTQKEIWRKVQKNMIENGTVIIADVQTEAIGTHGRVWYTEQKNNIAFSLIVFPNCNINKLENLTYDIAQIFVDIFKTLYSIDINIKLPNDLMVNNKKVGGILTETKLQGICVKELVIGVGINTNQTEMSKEIKDISTSIKKEFDININNYSVISEFCNRLEKKIESL